MTAGGYAAAGPVTAGRAADGTGYVDGPIRAFAIATVFWGVIGFLVGLGAEDAHGHHRHRLGMQR